MNAKRNEICADGAGKAFSEQISAFRGVMELGSAEFLFK